MGNFKHPERMVGFCIIVGVMVGWSAYASWHESRGVAEAAGGALLVGLVVPFLVWPVCEMLSRLWDWITEEE